MVISRAFMATIAALSMAVGGIAPASAQPPAATAPPDKAQPDKPTQEPSAPSQRRTGPTATDEPSDASRARTVALIARDAAKGGNYRAAAQLFGLASTLDPTDWSFVYSVARAEQLGGRYELSKKHYDRFFAGVTTKHPLYAKAKTHSAKLPSLIADRKAVAAASAKRKTLDQRWRAVGWAGIGGGLALAAAGGWLLAGGLSAQRSLEARLAEENGDSQIVGIDYATAATEGKRISGELTAGAIGLGVGAAAAIAGAVLLLQLDDDSKVALVPVASRARGVAVRIAF